MEFTSIQNGYNPKVFDLHDVCILMYVFICVYILAIDSFLFNIDYYQHIKRSGLRDYNGCSALCSEEGDAGTDETEWSRDLAYNDG